MLTEEQKKEYRDYFADILKRAKGANVRDFYRELAQNSNPKMQGKYRKYFARKCEVNPDKIKIALEFVENKVQNGIFKSAMSFWSVPVSAGYGRRIRIIIWDKAHYKVFGIVGFCDPVIGLKNRDDYIGWGREQKYNRLYNMMNAYILGAVPPYNKLLGAKLVALTAGSKEVSDYFRNKYEGVTTIIRKKKHIPELVAVDTMGAFGQSAIYHSLKEWKFLGYTTGYSHYHLTLNGNWEKIYSLAKEMGIGEGNGYGKGSNWKFRVIQEVFQKLGMSSRDYLKVGHQRGYYFRPLIKNWKEFLLGETSSVERVNKTVEEYFDFWKRKFFRKGVKRWNS